MSRLQFSRALMIAAILLIVAFQGYWINRIYKEERTGLQKEANGIFRDVVYNLQVERFKADTVFLKQTTGDNLFVYNAVNAIRHKVATLRKDSMKLKMDTTRRSPGSMIILRNDHYLPDSMPVRLKGDTQNRFFYMQRHGAPEMPPLDTMFRKMTQPGIKVVIREGMQPGRRPPELVQNITLSPDSSFKMKRPNTGRVTAEKSFIRMISKGTPIDDTIAVAKVDSAYKRELAKAGIQIGFTISMGKDDSLHQKDTISAGRLKTDIAKVGIINQHWYQAGFENPVMYLVKKISPQILFSLFLVVFTTVVFIFLYRNLAQQRRLSEMKNDFISNITHELKTPIATVSVAVEALRNFGGLQKPERTKEYLDISAGELQRLGLLVDKVLKLSMFEKDETALQKESFDLLDLITEVMASMKLQFENQHAVTSLESTGDNFMIDADRVHITSVIYNLLDNALKYSKADPRIDVKLIRHEGYFELRISDKGIGIPAEYQRKVFDQFFRVPTGNRHNVKGYGLGLSYINHIVKRHQGLIEVESIPERGSTFIVKLPFAGKATIHFDKDRKISKENS